MKRTEIEERLNEIKNLIINEFKKSTSLFEFNINIDFTLHFILRLMERYTTPKDRKLILNDIEFNFGELMREHIHYLFKSNDSTYKITGIKYHNIQMQDVVVFKVEKNENTFDIKFLTVIKSNTNFVKTSTDTINTYKKKKFINKKSLAQSLKMMYNELPDSIKLINGLYQ